MILKASAENGSSRSAWRSMTSSSLPTAWPLMARDVERAREVVDDRVEQRLHALVLERGAAQDRVDACRRCVARRMAGDELLLGGLLALEVELHDLVVVLGERLEELVAPLAGGLGVVGRDVDDVVHLALGRSALQSRRLHLDQVDDALEVGLGAPSGAAAPAGSRCSRLIDHVDAAVELRADAVHLVDEADPRHVVAVGLAPHRLGLRLDAGDGVEHGDRAVEHAQRALHLDGEVDVARACR